MVHSALRSNQQSSRHRRQTVDASDAIMFPCRLRRLPRDLSARMSADEIAVFLVPSMHWAMRNACASADALPHASSQQRSVKNAVAQVSRM